MLNVPDTNKEMTYETARKEELEKERKQEAYERTKAKVTKNLEKFMVSANTASSWKYRKEKVYAKLREKSNIIRRHQDGKCYLKDLPMELKMEAHRLNITKEEIIVRYCDDLVSKDILKTYKNAFKEETQIKEEKIAMEVQDAVRRLNRNHKREKRKALLDKLSQEERWKKELEEQ